MKAVSQTGIRPLADRVLVRRDEAPGKSAGGIHLPETAKNAPARGTVLAVGAGGRDAMGNLHPLTVAVGDRVLFTAYAGNPVDGDDRNLLMLREAEIQAVLD